MTLADARQIFDSQAQTHQVLAHQLHQLVETASQAISQLGPTALQQPNHPVSCVPLMGPGVMVSHRFNHLFLWHRCR